LSAGGIPERTEDAAWRRAKRAHPVAEFEIPAQSSDGVPITRVVLDVTSSCTGGEHRYPTYTGRPGETIQGFDRFQCLNGHNGVATIAYAPLAVVLRGPAPADGSSMARVQFETAEGRCYRDAPIEDRKGVTFFVQGGAEVHYGRSRPAMTERALRKAVARLDGRSVRVVSTDGRTLRGILDARGSDGIALRVAGDDRLNFLGDEEVAAIDEDDAES
jgi:hypothetical protein